MTTPQLTWTQLRRTQASFDMDTSPPGGPRVADEDEAPPPSSPASRRTFGQGGLRRSTDGDGRSPAISSLRAIMTPGSALTRSNIALGGDEDAELW